LKSKAGLDTGIDKSRVGLKKKTPTDVDDPAKLEAEKKKKPSVPKVTRRSRTPKKKTNTDEKEQKPVKKTPHHQQEPNLGQKLQAILLLIKRVMYQSKMEKVVK